MTHNRPTSTAVRQPDGLAPSGAAPGAPGGGPADAHTGAQPFADRAALRDRIAQAIRDARHKGLMLRDDAMADAVLTVLPAQAAEVRAAARDEGAIDALRTAAEHMRVGVAIGPIPPEVRPAVEAWLCRLADQRLDHARRTAADRLHAELAARPDDTTEAELEPLPAPTARQPLTDQQLTPAEIRLAQYGQRTKAWTTATYDSGTEKALHQIALDLKAELDRLRAQMTETEITE